MKFSVVRWTGIAGLLCLAQAASAGTFLKIDSLHPDDLKAVGFEVKQSMEVDVEAVGILNRYSDDDLSAYAWIIDSKTRDVVWDMRESFASKIKSSKHLLQAEESLRLSPGKYELYYFAGSPFFSGVVNITENDVEWEDEENKDKDGSWADALANIFGGGSKDYSRSLKECYVTLSSNSGADVTRFTATGELPGAILKHTKLGDEESIRDGFALTKPMSLRIYAVVEYPDGYNSAVDQMWIVNEATNERVWELDKFNTRWAGGCDKNRMYDDEVSFPAGKYILQVYTDDSHSYEHFNAAPPYDPLNWGITILPGKGYEASAFSVFSPGDRGKSILEMTRVRDDEYREKLFKVVRPTKVRIYALGEFDKSDRVFADHGWIEDAATRKVIWEMDRTNTEFAGGGHKNRMFDGTITLQPGDYRAAYITDGSHAYRSWNASAPYEPNAWGMTFYPGEGYKDGDITTLNESDLAKSNADVLVSIVRIRDNQERSQSFHLNKSGTVHIYAIGEGVSGDMADYGYIIDKESGRAVWEMTWRNTRHAGGADKNRLFDGDIMLDAGDYEVYFVTDGSHAFNDWNDTRPRDANNWGITVSLASR